MLGLLRNKNFRFLWLGQMASQSGDRLTQLILLALVALVEPGSSLSLAKVLTFTSLPGLLVSPIAGAYVDRWDRRRTMIVCDLIRVAGVLALPWLAAEGRRGFLYLDILFLFTVTSFFVPARLASIPDLVEPGELAKANAAFTTSGMIGSAVIILAGALLVEWIGAARSCWVSAIAYAVSAAFILPLKGRFRPPVSARIEPPQRIVSEVWEGIRRLWMHRDTRRVVALIGLLMAGGGASLVVGTVLVQRWLGSVTKDIGFLSLWLGVGMFLGTLAYGRWGTLQPRRRILGASFLGAGSGVAMFLMMVTAARSGAGSSLAAAVLGFFMAPAGIVANTLVHEAHPERLHGRIFSSLGVVANAGLISSMLAAGWLGEQIGQGRLLALLGLGFVLAGAALLYYPRQR
ncbi:MAG: MFS transporter [Candidatus Omnitrophica bacterium]|nr:MFS transporter [Candidatus Omnitrophota bacterium]